MVLIGIIKNFIMIKYITSKNRIIKDKYGIAKDAKT
jgi:hypothetical protein